MTTHHHPVNMACNSRNIIVSSCQIARLPAHRRRQDPDAGAIVSLSQNPDLGHRGKFRSISIGVAQAINRNPGFAFYNSRLLKVFFRSRISQFFSSANLSRFYFGLQVLQQSSAILRYCQELTHTR